jgi:hypothetical protein
VSERIRALYGDDDADEEEDSESPASSEAEEAALDKISAAHAGGQMRVGPKWCTNGIDQATIAQLVARGKLRRSGSGRRVTRVNDDRPEHDGEPI